MNNQVKGLAIAGAVQLLSMPRPALAHTISIEPQALHTFPRFAPPSADYSFTRPLVLTSVVDSQAIFAYLSPGDVDVYQFTLTEQDVANGPVLVSASALSPGCVEYLNVYPVTALLGPQSPNPQGPPGLPAWDGRVWLPFAVPDGFGVVFADNPKQCYPQRRELFTQQDPGAGTLSWFLPKGLTQSCLLENQGTCDFSNTIAQPVFYPGTYSIVMWNPTGAPADYTANIGYDESNYESRQELEALVRDNALLHRPCHSASGSGSMGGQK